MSLPLLILVLSFTVLLFLNVPVGFCIGIATLLAVLAVGDLPALMIVAQRMATGIDEFSLLAIPFFILAGLFMGQGGIARRLIDFAHVLVGPLPGGLAFVNVITCMLFGGISGSAAAAVSAVGGFMVPMMNERGYGRDFTAALTLTASTTGLLIPPSNVMIVYSLATGGAVSIAALFVAGIVPGILMGLGLMAVAGMISIYKGYGRTQWVKPREAIVRFLSALPALLLIVIVLGGILGGIFTATEASAIAVVYSFALSVLVYREVSFKQVPRILLTSAVTTAVVMLLIATSTALGWVLTYENVPQRLGVALLSISDNPLMILLLINLLLLVVGTFMDMTPAVLIFTPIFLPVVINLGYSPLHFGIMMIMNLCIGLCTPPVGTMLFLGCGIAKTTVSRIMLPLLPCYAAMLAVLGLAIYFPEISLWLPRQFDLVGAP